METGETRYAWGGEKVHLATNEVEGLPGYYRIKCDGKATLNTFTSREPRPHRKCKKCFPPAQKSA